MDEFQFNIIKAQILSCKNYGELLKFRDTYFVPDRIRKVLLNPLTSRQSHYIWINTSTNHTPESIKFYDALYDLAIKRIQVLFRHKPKSPFPANTKPPNRRQF